MPNEWYRKRWQEADDPLEKLQKCGKDEISGVTQQVVVFDQRPEDARDSAKRVFLLTTIRSFLLEMTTGKMLVFVALSEFMHEIQSKLIEEGHDNCEVLEGKMSKAARKITLEKFQFGSARLLLATSGIAQFVADQRLRGVTHMINFDWCDMEEYATRMTVLAAGGLAVTFFEYDENNPAMADAYVRMLESSGQEVSKELRTIAKEVDRGQRTISKAFFKHKKQKVEENWRAETKKIVCEHFAMGQCKKGISCWYKHDLAAVMPRGPLQVAPVLGGSERFLNFGASHSASGSVGVASQTSSIARSLQLGGNSVAQQPASIGQFLNFNAPASGQFLSFDNFNAS